jgi:hypothetical protein
MQGEKEMLLFNSLGAIRWIVRPYSSAVTTAGVSQNSVTSPSPPTSPKAQSTSTNTNNSPRNNGRGWGFRKQRRDSLPMVSILLPLLTVLCVLQYKHIVCEFFMGVVYKLLQ